MMVIKPISKASITLLVVFTLSGGIEAAGLRALPLQPSVSAAAATAVNTGSAEEVSNGWEVNRLVQTAAYYINQFWGRAFAAAGLRYYPPRIVQSTVQINNAMYDGNTNTIVYDYAFFNQILHQDGDFAVVTILAHEWGHLVQRQAGEHLVIGMERELQADCYAGVFAYSEGATTRLEPSDIEKALHALIKAADGPATDLLSQTAHGNSDQRLTAFWWGYRNGISSCSNQAILGLAVNGQR